MCDARNEKLVGDLRRRKSGKEAREVKVEKVKIGKNGKGRS